ncbi:hypothetical protein N7513_000186 [Penicillium frequentans]|nr:hypothetical protein N7513_000186 [Penicillium glabrum]
MAQLESSLFPFASSAENNPNGGSIRTPSRGPSRARDLQSDGERPCPTIRIQDLRQLGSSTPVQTLAMQATDDDIIMAENFCHVNVPLNTVYQYVFAFYEQQHDARFREAPFPNISLFNSFIQLYYEHFDDQLPFIHPSLLEQADTPWMLALAVASVGCQYTNVAKRDTYVSMLTDLLTLSLPLDVCGDWSFCVYILLISPQALQSRGCDTMLLAQCFLLNLVNLMFSGFKDHVLRLQVQRAWLATLMRPFLTSAEFRDSLLSTEPSSVQSNGQWPSWIRRESKRRLVYCFLVLDCFFFIFLGMQPTFSAKDYEQILPSSDALWRMRNEDEWSSHFRESNGQHSPKSFLELFKSSYQPDTAQPFSLKELFSLKWTANNAFLNASDFSKLVLHLALFVEERRAIDASNSCALLDFSHENQISDSDTRPPTSYRTLDWKYEMLATTSESVTSTSTSILDARNTFFHLLEILRNIPLKQLYAYSGWYASEEDIAASGTYLAGWMRDNPVLARNCVAHAGAILRQIRSTPTTACYHYFCILIAFLYLWTFERLKPDASPAHEQYRQLDTIGTLLKIDQRHDPSVRERWVQGNPGILVHITGVGMLSASGTAQRLVKELLRVLGSRTGWPTFRKGLIICVSQLVNEASPIEVP